MKAIRTSIFALTAITAVGVIASAFAEEAKPETGKIDPESLTLPANVFRFRAIYGASWGDHGYDKDGKKTETGVSVKGQGGAAVFEYGIAQHLSGQFLMPFKTSTALKVSDETKFATTVKNSSAFATARADTLTKVTAAAPTAGALISGNTTAPLDITIPGLGTIKTGEKCGDAFDALVLAQAVPSAKQSQVTDKKFATGLGDIEMGVKYNFSDFEHQMFEGVPVYFSLATGLRFPTGSFEQAQKDGKVENGRGTFDGAVRVNVDAKIIQGVVLSVENQSEMNLMKGKFYNGTKDVDFERTGVRQVGYGKLVIAPGAWIPAIDALSITPKYNYDFDSNTKIDGVKGDSALVPQSQSFTTSLGLSGFNYNVPVQFDLDYTMPLSGKNQTFATSSIVGNLKLFYKF